MEEGERFQRNDRDTLRKSASKYDFVKVGHPFPGTMQPRFTH